MWERVTNEVSEPGERAVHSSNVDPSPAFASLRHPLPQGERGKRECRAAQRTNKNPAGRPDGALHSGKEAIG